MTLTPSNPPGTGSGRFVRKRPMLTLGAWFVLVAAMTAVTARHSVAQTTLPPAPTVNETRPDFSGTWVLDRSISTDPVDVRFDDPGNATGQGSRSGRGRFGFGRGNATNRGGNEVLTPIERSRLDVLTQALKTSAATLTISHHDPSFVVADAQDHAQFFHTSGESDENHVGSETITGSARWDGSRIVTEFSVSSRVTLTYTYTLLPKTNQLVVRVNRKDEGLQRTIGSEVKLVYKLAPAQATGSANRG